MNLEVNEREIQPQNIWLNGINSIAVIINIDGYSGYNFVNSPGQVHYNMMSYDTQSETKTRILSGVCPLDWATVENWGADDQVIFNFVANNLGLILI
jgi:hypothetical protein